MTPQDIGEFGEWFQDLGRMFKLYGTEEQKAAMLSSYFQTLQRFPLGRVRLGYEKLKETAQKWPAPAAWIQAMPKGESLECPLMTPAQQRESDDAERKFYEGGFCRCVDCTAANATHLSLRYVPQLDRDGKVIKLQHPGKSQPVVIGEWIHGARLRAWHTARAEFYEQLATLKPGVKAELVAVGGSETGTPVGHL